MRNYGYFRPTGTISGPCKGVNTHNPEKVNVINIIIHYSTFTAKYGKKITFEFTDGQVSGSIFQYAPAPPNTFAGQIPCLASLVNKNEKSLGVSRLKFNKIYYVFVINEQVRSRNGTYLSKNIE